MKHRWHTYAVVVGCCAALFLFTMPVPAWGATPGECQCLGVATASAPYCQAQYCTATYGTNYFCHVPDIAVSGQPGTCQIGIPSAVSVPPPISFPAPTTTTTFSDFLCNIIGFIRDTLLPPIAVFMMLLAGFFFMLSGQEPQKATTAKKILLYTVIGTVLFLMAPGIVALIADALGATGPFWPVSCPTTMTASTVTNVLIAIVNWFSWLVAITSVAMGLYAGFVYLTSRGDPRKIQQAAKTFSYTIIGIAVSIVAFSIVSLVKVFLS